MPDGTLRLAHTKTDLDKIFQDLPQNDVPRPMPTCTVIDGMAIIKTLGKRMNAKTRRMG
jgi:hypothetical protein